MKKSHKPPDLGPDWWRDIPSYPGYQVDRLGNVRKVLPSGSVINLSPFQKRNQGCSKRGTVLVGICSDGKRREVSVSKIMADAFLGGTPPGKITYHKNGIVTDNRLENIGFTTRKELGSITKSRFRSQAVLKIDQSGETVAIYRSAREAARQNYMNYQTVLDRCHRKIKKEYALDGYTYRFEDEDGRCKRNSS